MTNSFNIQELLHPKSKCHETKPMHSSALKAFQRNQERNLKHFNQVDLISTNKTKQNNKLPCFIRRYCVGQLQDCKGYLFSLWFLSIYVFDCPSIVALLALKRIACKQCLFFWAKFCNLVNLCGRFFLTNLFSMHLGLFFT